MELRVDLKAKPFYLNDEQIGWVEKTIEGMTFDEKIGQLFLFMSMGTEPASARAFAARGIVQSDPGEDRGFSEFLSDSAVYRRRSGARGVKYD